MVLPHQVGEQVAATFSYNIPVISMMGMFLNGGIAQLARASALQAEGRRFDSDYLHHQPTQNHF